MRKFGKYIAFNVTRLVFRWRFEYQADTNIDKTLNFATIPLQKLRKTPLETNQCCKLIFNNIRNSATLFYTFFGFYFQFRLHNLAIIF